MFESRMNRLKIAIIQQLSQVEVNIDEQTYQKMLDQQRSKEEDQARLTREDPALSSPQAPSQEGSVTPIRGRGFDQNNPATWDANVPRNAPCPCGSGKKFKYCHGKVE